MKSCTAKPSYRPHFSSQPPPSAAAGSEAPPTLTCLTTLENKTFVALFSHLNFYLNKWDYAILNKSVSYLNSFIVLLELNFLDSN